MSNSGESSKGNDSKPGPWVWLKNQVWRDNLARAAAYRALDMPDSGTNIHSGLDWKGLAVIAAGLLGGGWLLKDALRPPPVPRAAPASRVHREYEFRIYDAQGRLVGIPRLPAAKTREPANE